VHLDHSCVELGVFARLAALPPQLGLCAHQSEEAHIQGLLGKRVESSRMDLLGSMSTMALSSAISFCRSSYASSSGSDDSSFCDKKTARN